MADHLLPPANLLWSESYQPTIMNFVQNKVLIQFIHRWWAFAAAILCFIMIFTSIKFSVTARARRGLRVMASLLVLQILLGILTLLWQVPPVMGIIHLAVGMILFAILVHVTYELRNHESRLLNYILLTKPRILLLVLLTGVTALIVEGSLLIDPGSFLLVLLGLFLASGSANAFNQYFERDVDALMKRTAGRRPLPMGKLVPIEALIFALVLGAGSAIIFAECFNMLSSLLALATVIFYGFFYTLVLKPERPV